MRKKRPRKRDRRHLEAIAQLPSVISGKVPVQVCHIRHKDIRFDKPQTGMGIKPDDKWVLPMTPEEHAEQHSMSEYDFWWIHGIDATIMADELHSVWDDTLDTHGAILIMRRIILLDIARRNVHDLSN